MPDSGRYFSITVNLPNINIDDFYEDLLKFYSTLGGRYIVYREDGKSPPESSHHHIWIMYDTRKRSDNIMRDKFKPAMRKLGFTDEQLSDSKGKYRGVFVQRIKPHTHDYRMTLGYVSKHGDCLYNNLTGIELQEMTKFVGRVHEILQHCKDYREQYSVSQKKKRKRLTQIGDYNTLGKLDQFEGKNYAEKCIDAHQKGIYLQFLPKYIRLSRCLNNKMIKKIYDVFQVHYRTVPIMSKDMGKYKFHEHRYEWELSDNIKQYLDDYEVRGIMKWFRPENEKVVLTRIEYQKKTKAENLGNTQPHENEFASI